MGRCWGRTRNFTRCQRCGDWRFFCHEHRWQSVIWLVSIITFIGAPASIYSCYAGATKQDTQEIARLQLENTNAVTGGDSFCEILFQIAEQDGNLIHIMSDDLILVPLLLNRGKYPLYGVSVRIADIDQIKNGIWEQSLKEYNIGDLTPGYLTSTSIRLPHHGKDLNYNIFYVARNGAWVQILRMRWVGNGWGTATKILKGLGGEELYRDVSSNFPRGPNGEIDWSE